MPSYKDKIVAIALTIADLYQVQREIRVPSECVSDISDVWGSHLQSMHSDGRKRRPCFSMSLRTVPPTLWPNGLWHGIWLLIADTYSKSHQPYLKTGRMEIQSYYS